MIALQDFIWGVMRKRFRTEESMNLEIANRLVALRKEKHLSQEALAEKLGISRQAVSKWERAEASPDTDNLIALAKLYHISLDELLKIHEEEEDGCTEEWDTGPEVPSEDPCAMDGADMEEAAENGFAGQEGQDGDDVHIGIKGIHVKEHNGNEVHIGWNGIHVHDQENEVHIDRNGIYIDGENAGDHIFTHGKESAEFPLGVVAIIAYIVIGVCFDLWHPGWLVFLLVPVIGSLIHAVRCRNAYLFAYPVFMVFIFLYVGLVHFIWHPTWVVFVTVPLYYSIVRYIRGRNEE